MNEEIVVPTSASELLLQLYRRETGCDETFIGIDILRWWIKKLLEPSSEDCWLSISKWRYYARHIHALIAANEPFVVNEVAYDLGIESSLIPKPKMVIHSDGTIGEEWSVEEFQQSRPPFGFRKWQQPLKVTKTYTWDFDEKLLDQDMGIPKYDSNQDPQVSQLVDSKKA